MRLRHSFAGAALWLCMTGTAGMALASGPMAADYLAAARLLPGNLQGLVRNETVKPHWIGSSGTFWYQRDGGDGPEFVLVTASGARSPAFNHGAVAQALAAALGRPAQSALPAELANVALSDNISVMTGSVDGNNVECQLKPASCRILARPPADPAMLPSPNGRQAAFAR
jgi:dipeptidyl-peptidase 4